MNSPSLTALAEFVERYYSVEVITSDLTPVSTGPSAGASFGRGCSASLGPGASPAASPAASAGTGTGGTRTATDITITGN